MLGNQASEDEEMVEVLEESDESEESEEDHFTIDYDEELLEGDQIVKTFTF
ncbi:hypothetical protein [Alkaliphilus metalliredigens]|uniref:hypothetical protein n=1 Tax=Alkaliphilus metalliredigens TaxID=208226 RepID=UPI00005CC9D0|nr:hypothetical protein [Alkaliphilus metalliredigens]